MLGIREHDEYNLHLLQQRKLLLQLLCVERKGNINMWNIFVGKGERRWEVKGVIPLSLLLCGDCFLGVKWCCVDFLKGMPGFYMDFFPFLPYLTCYFSLLPFSWRGCANILVCYEESFDERRYGFSLKRIGSGWQNRSFFFFGAYRCIWYALLYMQILLC